MYFHQVTWHSNSQLRLSLDGIVKHFLIDFIHSFHSSMIICTWFHCSVGQLMVQYFGVSVGQSTDHVMGRWFWLLMNHDIYPSSDLFIHLVWLVIHVDGWLVRQAVNRLSELPNDWLNWLTNWLIVRRCRLLNGVWQGAMLKSWCVCKSRRWCHRKTHVDEAPHILHRVRKASSRICRSAKILHFIVSLFFQLMYLNLTECTNILKIKAM